MAEKDDGLGLSLSLRCPESPGDGAAPFPLNLLRSSLPFMQQNKISNSHVFQSSADRTAESRPVYRGIDVNRSAAAVIDCEEEVAAASSSPNSAVSSLSGKRSEREENDGERASSSMEMEEEDEDEEGGGGDVAARKKLRLSKVQSAVLEETFKEHCTLNPRQKLALAKELNLRPRQVEVWFQNRRARTKLKQTEVDCEYLRWCCENLTEEKRRLQREVSELRALKVSPQFYMNMNPSTTLTMCPQCERVAISSPSSFASASLAPSLTSVAMSCQPPHQRSAPLNSWAAIIPSLPINARQP